MKHFHKYLTIKIILCQGANYPHFIEIRKLKLSKIKQFGPNHWFENARAKMLELKPALTTRNLKLFSPCH